MALQRHQRRARLAKVVHMDPVIGASDGEHMCRRRVEFHRAHVGAVLKRAHAFPCRRGKDANRTVVRRAGKLSRVDVAKVDTPHSSSVGGVLPGGRFFLHIPKLYDALIITRRDGLLHVGVVAQRRNLGVRFKLHRWAVHARS